MEMIHWRFEETQGFDKALPILGTDPDARHKAYNDAASEILSEQ